VSRLFARIDAWFMWTFRDPRSRFDPEWMARYEALVKEANGTNSGEQHGK